MRLDQMCGVKTKLVHPAEDHDLTVYCTLKVGHVGPMHQASVAWLEPVSIGTLEAPHFGPDREKDDLLN